MSRNPNLMRTMIGIGLMLIFTLGYAVHSNTVNSEYYGYSTSNEEVSATLIQENNISADWYFTTNSAITWINTTIEGAPEDSIIFVEAIGTEWFHTPSLGLDEGDYSCKENTKDYSDIIETCVSSNFHQISTSDSNTLIGIVSLELPLGGLGYLQAESNVHAEEESENLISENKQLITWKIQLQDESGSVLENHDFSTHVSYTQHEIISVEKFVLDPIQESIYSLATLIGCFALLIILPLIAYFAASYKEKKDEKIRLITPEISE